MSDNGQSLAPEKEQLRQEFARRMWASFNQREFKAKARAAGLDVRLDFCNADLRDEDLTGQILSGVNLSGADLSGAKLNGCEFVGTNLAGANLTGAAFEPDRLRNADLTGAMGLGDGVAAPQKPPSPDLARQLRYARSGEVAALLLEPHCDRFSIWELATSGVWTRMVAGSGNVDHESGRLDAARPLVHVLRSGRPRVLNREVCLPIFVRSRIIGALQVTVKQEIIDAGADVLPELERAAKVLGSIWDESDLTTLYSSLPRTLSDVKDTEEAMKVIVTTARRAISADWVAYVIGKADEPSPIAPAPVQGVSISSAKVASEADLLETARGLIASRGTRDHGEESPKQLVERIQRGKTQLGFLVADAGDRAPFGPRDRAILQSLGFQAGRTYAASRLIDYLERIEGAIAGLGGVEDLYRRTCARIKERSRLDFVALQIRNASEGIIETVAGTDIAQEWVGRARHPLSRTKGLRDIQADIVLRGRGEVVQGATDPRLDKGLYEQHKHAGYMRVFLPLVVFRNADDRRVRPELAKTVEWRVRRVRKPGASKYVLDLTAPPGVEVEVMGTIEGGIKLDGSGAGKGTRLTDESKLRKLASTVTSESLRLYRGSLQNALEQILAATASMAGADSATLHFLRRRNKRYVMEAAQGHRGAKFLYQRPPRPGGLGMDAIRARKPMWLSGEKLKKRNPLIWKEGTRAMVAFPLIAGVDRFGVLYVHFNDPRDISEADIRVINIVASQAGAAIRLAADYAETSERERLLRALQKTSEELQSMLAEFRSKHPRAARPSQTEVANLRRDLLQSVASNAVNILAADVVTIHEFERSVMKRNPVWMGRLLHEQAMTMTVGPKEIPHGILDVKQDIFTSIDPSKDKRLRGAKERNFVKREKIRSVAAVKLKSGKEVVGVMFVNYRRRHEFTGDELSLIQLFASSAARFIKESKEHLDDAVQSFGTYTGPSLATPTPIPGVVVTSALPTVTRSARVSRPQSSTPATISEH